MAGPGHDSRQFVAQDGVAGQPTARNETLWENPVPLCSESGRQRKQYVPRNRIPDVLAAIEAWRVAHPPAYRVRALLALCRRFGDEALQAILEE